MGGDDAPMVNVPMQMGHLEELCATVSSKKAGCSVVRLFVHSPTQKALDEALDRRYFTTRKVGAKYLDVVFGPARIYSMWDTGANFSMITIKLAKALGIPVFPFKGTFTTATGEEGEYAGKLGRITVQLHNKLAVELDGVRVLKADYMGAILGMDVMDETGAELRTCGIVRDGDFTFLTVEAGAKHSGVLFQL